jgi:VWFA-related protein
MRLFAIAALSLGLALSALPQAAPENPYTIRQEVVNIVVPVTVRRSDGTPVGGIRPQQFRLFDNNRLQDIRVDADYLPVSVVMVVQANSRAEGAIERVKKTPALVQSLIIGEQGEAAVLAFDHRMQVKTDFTTDYNKIKAAVDDIKVGSSTAALNDAVMTAINMLRRRDKNRRRVILLIAETRDGGSEQNTRNVVQAAEMNNIQVYAVNISQVMKQLTSRAQPPRPDPIPPESRGLYPGTVNTPTTVAQITGGQGGSAQFVPLLEELVRATGGREFSFATLRGLEEALAGLGEELHSQYILSYTPSEETREEGGYHQIQIVVDGYNQSWVKHRPGYYWGGMPQGSGN